MPATRAPGILALSAALLRHVRATPRSLLPLRISRVAAVLYCSIADYQRLTRAGRAIPRAEFVDDLITSLVGLLGGEQDTSRPEAGSG
jgi:hypothetical protein